MSARFRAVLPIALILCAAPARAAAPVAAPPAPRPAPPAGAAALDPATFRVERHVLPNGLTVLLHEDHSVPTLTFWQWYKVGSRNEAPGITGISHFFEHMMFNGSKNVPPKEYDRILESSGGDSNAFTDRDMTAYYEDIASDRPDVVLRLDSDRMASLSLPPEQMKSEIEVVKEERRLRTDNSIPGLLDEKLYATAFEASPYRWPVVGWMEDLNRITREDCVSYFRTWYAPGNCILVMVGDFEPATALRQITEAFGAIPAQKPPAPPSYVEPPQLAERRAEVRHLAENESFEVGYRAPGVKSPDAVVLDVLAQVLSGGESSRLHQALVYERQMALDASASFPPRVEPGLFEVYVEMRPGHTAAEGLAVMDSVFQRLVSEGPTARELEKAKNLIEARFVKTLKTNNGVGSQLGFYEHVYGDWSAMFGQVGRARAVTAADCRRVARETFDPARRTVVTLVPRTEAAPVEAQP